MTVLDKEKSGELLRVKDGVLEWDRLPLVPVMVSVEVPRGAPLMVVTVMTVVPEPATVGGLKVMPDPAGSPVAAKDTEPLKPPAGTMLMVQAAVAPGEMVRDAGVVLMAKSTALTTRPIGRECARVPLASISTRDSAVRAARGFLTEAAPFVVPASHAVN